MSGATTSLKKLCCIHFAFRGSLILGFVTVIVFVYFQVYIRQSSSYNLTVNKLKNRIKQPHSKSYLASIASAKKSSPVNLKFYDISASGIYSFSNVCIETITDAKSHNKLHRIVVYNNIYGNNKTFAKLLVTDTAMYAKHLRNWTVYFTSGPIPKYHRVLPTSAFFASPIHMNNLYHFWNDLFVRIFSVIKSTNRLRAGMNNQILYHDNHQSNYRTVYEVFLRTLSTTEFYDVYYKLPTNTCYSSAVFGAKNNLKRYRDVVDHVLAEFNISSSSIEKINDSIVLIRRTNRKIININDLKDAAESIGFRSVKVISFETMSVKEQLSVAANTRVMVGVQGGELQWSVFMPPGSTLIEFSNKYWPPFYGFVQSYDINYLNVAVSDLRVNWKSYETQQGETHIKNQQPKLMNMTLENSKNANHLWKSADVFVDVDKFKQILKQV